MNLSLHLPADTCPAPSCQDNTKGSEIDGDNRTSSLVALVTLLICVPIGGCALGASKLSPAQCQSADWQAIGEQDGKLGRYPHELGRHIQACHTISTPDRKLWEQGRNLGLKSYCTKSNAYELGRLGYPLNQVCPEEGLLEIQQSHALGYQQYYRQEQLNHWRHSTPWYSPYAWWW